MLRWFPSDDRQSKYERFGSLTEIFSIQTTNFENTHTRTQGRTDPQEIIWEGSGRFYQTGTCTKQGQN